MKYVIVWKDLNKIYHQFKLVKEDMSYIWYIYNFEANRSYIIDYYSDYLNTKIKVINCILPLDENDINATIERFEKLLVLKN